MATALKTLGLCFAAWLLPMAASFLLVVIAAGINAHWRGPDWIVGVVVLIELAAFAVASLLLWWGLSPFLAVTSSRALVFGLHALLQLATFAIMGFSTLVAFNR
jgi:hypothetical protein